MQIIAHKDDKGRTWAAISGLLASSDYLGESVVLPLKSLEGATAEEIIEIIRALTPKAAEAGVRLEAASFIYSANSTPRGQWQSMFDSETIDALWAKLQPYLHLDIKPIREAALLLKEIEAHVQQVRQIKAERYKKRKVIAANYSDIFVTIGNRDGFRCANCHAVDNLQIDHVRPLTQNGGNELENLQLLCAACNNAKGAQEIDYRGASLEVRNVGQV